MKIITILIVIILGIIGYIAFDNSSETPDGEGAIIETYNIYKGGINDARSVVSDIEARSRNIPE